MAHHRSRKKHPRRYVLAIRRREWEGIRKIARDEHITMRRAVQHLVDYYGRVSPTTLLDPPRPAEVTR